MKSLGKAARSGDLSNQLIS